MTNNRNGEHALQWIGRGSGRVAIGSPPFLRRFEEGFNETGASKRCLIRNSLHKRILRQLEQS